MTTVDAGGIGPAGATNGAIGNGVTAFLTKVVTVPVTVTMAGARAGTSPIQICAVYSPGGVGVIHSNRPGPPPMLPSGAVKTASDRAVEAIEAAEKIFAEEMGATLDLTPAAKAVLIETITAAIQAAVAEERQQLKWVL